MTSPNLKQQIEDWLHSRKASFQSDSRPFITLSYAQSWDGSLTTHSGETLCFSGEESMQITHQLRSLHDGILIGIGTVLSDDPQLTVRECSGPNPQPIVLDSQLRTPADAKLCSHPDRRCWVVTGKPDAQPPGDNIEVLTVPNKDSESQRSPLDAAVKLLRERGIKSLMVEGGANVITAFSTGRPRGCARPDHCPQARRWLQSGGGLTANEREYSFGYQSSLFRPSRPRYDCLGRTAKPQARGMKAQQLWFTEPFKVEVREQELPAPTRDQVLVRNLYSGISAGTEMLVYRGQVPESLALDATLSTLGNGRIKYPLQYGYASVGRIESVGSAGG